MTRDQLIAQAEALEWAAKTPWPEYIDSRTAILAKAEELRAQAEAVPVPSGGYCPHCNRGAPPVEVTFSERHEICGTPVTAPPAMPRIVREGRDFDVRFHDNGAAVVESAHADSSVSNSSGTVLDESTDNAQSTAAAPPSAAQPVACLCCGTTASGVAIQHAECASAVICGSCVEVMRTAPDLAASVARLESAMRELRMALDPDDWMGEVRMIDFIDSALAEGE